MTTYFDNIMKLVKENKDLSKAPVNALNRTVTNAADKYNQLQWVSNTGSKEADNYIKTPSSQQDGYQKAIGSLNPELKSKQRLYEQETKNLYDNLSGIANLREIQNHFNQIYAGGVRDTNKAYDNAQKANSLALGNARDNALSAVGGLWSNAVQSSAISAQYANKMAAANLENEEKRLKDLANLRLNQANVPNVLGQLALNNASIKSQELQNRLNEAQITAYKKSSGWGGWGGYRSSYGGGNSTQLPEWMTLEQYLATQWGGNKQEGSQSPQEESSLLDKALNYGIPLSLTAWAMNNAPRLIGKPTLINMGIDAWRALVWRFRKTKAPIEAPTPKTEVPNKNLTDGFNDFLDKNGIKKTYSQEEFDKLAKQFVNANDIAKQWAKSIKAKSVVEDVADWAKKIIKSAK